MIVAENLTTEVLVNLLNHYEQKIEELEKRLDNVEHPELANVPSRPKDGK